MRFSGQSLLTGGSRYKSLVCFKAADSKMAFSHDNIAITMLFSWYLMFHLFLYYFPNAAAVLLSCEAHFLSRILLQSENLVMGVKECFLSI